MRAPTVRPAPAPTPAAVPAVLPVAVFATVLAGWLAIACVPAAATAQPKAADAHAVGKGRQLFMRCAACHARSATARAGTGPHLEGIVGRRVASVPGFRYSAMLQGQSFIWTRQALDRWMQSPQKQFPGMCIPFAGMAGRADRLALIAYLDSPGP